MHWDSHLSSETIEKPMDEQEITTLDGLAAALDADEGQAQAPEADAADAVEQDESTHEADAPEGEEAATDDTGQAPAAPADDVVVKWTTSGGEAIEAPLAELKSGYLRQQDYTHKTQALAEERKQAETAVAQQFQQAQQLTRDQAKLMQLREDLSAYQKADWNALYEQNPVEAGRLQAQWRQTEAQARELAAGLQSAAQQSSQAQAQRLQQATQQAMEALQREIPGFGAETIKAARETALAHGFSEAELAGITDARTFKVLHEAAQWRALQAKKPAVQNKVAAAPPKATKPGSATQPSTRKEAAFKQMQSRRDVNSLAAFIAASE